MSWREFIQFVKDKDSRVTENGDSLVIDCDGKRFVVSIDHDDVDLSVKEDLCLTE